MADLTIGENNGISRSISNRCPSHYIFKVESFSILAELDTYESEEFQVGGYKWKLIIHPNGNKNKNIEDHISLYLMLVDDGSSPKPGSEVYAIFRFFLHNQIDDNYLVIQDTIKSERRFYALKLEWGIDQLISLNSFKNPSNGYLVDDSCAFGVEVYICQQVTGKSEFLSLVKPPNNISNHTWKIDNFYSLMEEEESTTFEAGGHKWNIAIYPKGYSTVSGKYVSLFLSLAESETINLPPSSRVFAEFTLSILEQDSNIHKSRNAKCWFTKAQSGYGFSEFISISDISSEKKGYIKNKSCIVKANVTVRGVVKAL